MACGRPVVASPVGANNELVVDGVNGFKAKTDKEWFRALMLLYKNINLRRKMGLAGRKLVESKYSLQVNINKLINIFKSVYNR